MVGLLRRECISADTRSVEANDEQSNEQRKSLNSQLDDLMKELKALAEES